MTPLIHEIPSFDKQERLSNRNDGSTATKTIKVRRVTFVDARTDEQEQLHELADKSGIEILETLKSNRNASDIEDSLSQIVSISADFRSPFEQASSINGDVPKPGETVPVELSSVVMYHEEIEVPVDSQLDNEGRAYATGKRRDAIARVWTQAGTGKIIVNGKDIENYFYRPVLVMVVLQPLIAAHSKDRYDIIVQVKGDSLSSQAGAIRNGITKTLCNYEPELRPVLKRSGFLNPCANKRERGGFYKMMTNRRTQSRYK